MACTFLLSQGITTVQALISASPTELAPALEGQSEFALDTAKTKLSDWKWDVKQ